MNFTIRVEMAIRLIPIDGSQLIIFHQYLQLVLLVLTVLDYSWLNLLVTPFLCISEIISSPSFRPVEQKDIEFSPEVFRCFVYSTFLLCIINKRLILYFKQVQTPNGQ